MIYDLMKRVISAIAAIAASFPEEKKASKI